MVVGLRLSCLEGPQLYLIYVSQTILSFSVKPIGIKQLKLMILLAYSVIFRAKKWRGKSQVFFSPNTPIDLAYAICRDIGFKRVDDLGNYLSMPLFHKRVMTNTFNFVVSKVRNKLNEWKARKLSLARRIMLVKSVLLVVPNYFMSLVRIAVKLESQLIISYGE